MNTLKYILLGLFLLLCLALSAIGSRGCSWLSKASAVAEQQVDPALLLKRYEWFKDVLAQCDKKLADIEVYKTRLTLMDKDYENTPRKDWDRTDKEQYNLWTQEVAGVVASYNSLAAEYNSAMSKMNYRFTNIGALPKGASEPLPKEVREYKYQ